MGGPHILSSKKVVTEGLPGRFLRLYNISLGVIKSTCSFYISSLGAEDDKTLDEVQGSILLDVGVEGYKERVY